MNDHDSLLSEFNQLIGFAPPARQKGFRPRQWMLNRPNHPRWWDDREHTKWRERQTKQSTTKLSAGAAVERFFCHVLVITLRRTPERLAQFWRRFPKDWPFQQPEVFEAIDGASETPMPNWQANAGAWGCWRSWVAVLDKAIAEQWDRPILVMEDDCQFLPGSMQRVEKFVRSLPEDWEVAYPGGQNMRRSIPVLAGLDRCMGAERTHCVMIHPSFFRALVEFWRSWPSHVDKALCHLAPYRRFYIASPVLAIQGENLSTITHRNEPPRSWDSRTEMEAVTIRNHLSVPNAIIQ